ncbi:glycosyltransferase [Chitinophaga japonensis]|uniref:Cellulose synthase/poly-beta-1,6-N-acetylglucosamine synthase-like glycosyltransferase n=1 Tax=Chitinophaga japonensis TaxID=104662 RepID=A0A562SY01_CHIJA|nr:glycosyltransferase family 2 protein [Chitinophaga japonensis]TWI86202.1 cellulose synthase/poly-beta-1,6-N-acetylglucosamine synthase-like glycosyltransferase [Chitinophaga japonensis]
MIAVIEVILLSYLAGCILYNLTLSIAGRMQGSKSTPHREQGPYAKVAILVPAYKEDEVILATAQSYTRLNYPADRYEVIVIADSLQPSTLEQLRHTGVTVIPVSFDKSTKAKSLNAAFAQLEDTYDLALICDADNMLAPDFLGKVNHAFQEGEYAIQAQRVAKNLNTPFAVLDTANEIIANHLYRKGANALGLSSSVIGSGMAFHFPLIKSIMQDIDATGGFDKVLQLLVVSRGHAIYYLEDAHVFDEKVEHAATFEHQRRRWLSSQLVYLRQYWKKGWQQLFRGNVDYFNLAVCQNLLLPRLLLLVAVTVITVLYIVLHTYLLLPAVWWAALWVCNAISLLLPIPRRFFSRYLLTALLGLPRAAFIMVALLFRLKGANNRFIHTRHTQTTIDNPLLDVASK